MTHETKKVDLESWFSFCAILNDWGKKDAASNDPHYIQNTMEAIRTIYAMTYMEGNPEATFENACEMFDTQFPAYTEALPENGCVIKFLDNRFSRLAFGRFVLPNMEKGSHDPATVKLGKVVFATLITECLINAEEKMDTETFSNYDFLDTIKYVTTLFYVFHVKFAMNNMGDSRFSLRREK